jgi:hypothetical protein
MFGKKIDRFLGARTLARIILRLTNLLLLCPHRNRRTCFNFAGFGIEDPHCLFLIDKRMRLRQSVQLFQLPSHTRMCHEDSNVHSPDRGFSGRSTGGRYAVSSSQPPLEIGSFGEPKHAADSLYIWLTRRGHRSVISRRAGYATMRPVRPAHRENVAPHGIRTRSTEQPVPGQLWALAYSLRCIESPT